MPKKKQTNVYFRFFQFTTLQDAYNFFKYFFFRFNDWEQLLFKIKLKNSWVRKKQVCKKEIKISFVVKTTLQSSLFLYFEKQGNNEWYFRPISLLCSETRVWKYLCFCYSSEFITQKKNYKSTKLRLGHFSQECVWATKNVEKKNPQI